MRIKEKKEEIPKKPKFSISFKKDKEKEINIQKEKKRGWRAG